MHNRHDKLALLNHYSSDKASLGISGGNAEFVPVIAAFKRFCFQSCKILE